MQQVTSNQNQKTAVVTGVSTGIGRAIVDVLLENNWHVFGSVRKQEDVQTLASVYGQGFTPLYFDVTDKDAIAKSVSIVRAALNGRTLSGLINNAGVAVGGPLAYIPEEEIEFQFDVNVFGPLRVTQAYLPLLGTDKSLSGPPGRIVNMSSVAGKIASPLMAPYAMSKHALEAMSDALRRELMLHGIDVVIVGPGAVKTPIWAKADDLNSDQYRQTEYYDIMEGMKSAMQAVGDEGLDPEVIGNVVLDALVKQAPKTRYAILKSAFMNWTLPRLLPARVVDGAIAKRFGLKK